MTEHKDPENTLNVAFLRLLVSYKYLDIAFISYIPCGYLEEEIPQSAQPSFTYCRTLIGKEGMGALNHFFSTAATGGDVHSLPRNKGVKG